jgi:hypothetical protein
MSAKQIEKTAKAVLVNTTATTVIDTRCLYVSATGRRCRSLAARDTSRPSGLSSFCVPHSQLEQQYVNIESVSEELLGNADNFLTAVGINRVLGRLLVLQAQNRIPIRNAMALAYTAQVILSSLDAVRDDFLRVEARGTHNTMIRAAIHNSYAARAEEESEAEQPAEKKSDFQSQVDAAVNILGS